MTMMTTTTTSTTKIAKMMTTTTTTTTTTSSTKATKVVMTTITTTTIMATTTTTTKMTMITTTTTTTITTTPATTATTSTTATKGHNEDYHHQSWSEFEALVVSMPSAGALSMLGACHAGMPISQGRGSPRRMCRAGEWFEEDDSCEEGNIFEDASSEESANEREDVNVVADDSPSDNITLSESENEEPPQKGIEDHTYISRTAARACPRSRVRAQTLVARAAAAAGSLPGRGWAGPPVLIVADKEATGHRGRPARPVQGRAAAAPFPGVRTGATNILAASKKGAGVSYPPPHSSRKLGAACYKTRGTRRIPLAPHTMSTTGASERVVAGLAAADTPLSIRITPEALPLPPE
ncbi:putative GPI-anchored protein pfl2 [Schistocerca piceifrons]|uniref:putative GPI-anchored protein pfl2 n=1 Tax=Schistocerca piceifrons TaxID=274613 RepID=UPI001F5F5E3F|nr:putative GPI-anchored protein pfl2 [Schistocerca piceifrons]